MGRSAVAEDTQGLIAELRAFPIFEGLPDAVLEWLAREGRVITLAKGERMFEPGETADTMFIVLNGTIHVERHVGAQFLGTLTLRVGAVSGVLPYSRMRVYQGRSHALEPTRILRIARAKFPAMLALSEEFGARLVGLMSDRVRDIARHDQQREKLAALGTLAAGIAHELNNPAAAARRASTSLSERLAAMPGLTGRLARHGLTEAQVATLTEVCATAVAGARAETFSSLQRSRLEQAMGDWLEANGVPESWLLADTYVEAGVTVDDLARVAAAVPGDALPDALAWLDAMVASARLARDVGDATTRISGLVSAVKAYSHLDRAQDKQPTDLRTGLDSTLVMLGHKVRQRGAVITQQFADDFPSVPVYPGEINQVWTNLLDNALDAIADGGHIRIEGLREGHLACVRVIDDGAGIPAELQSRIFEPFFTTKAVGQGTGLGLDIVQRIVVQHHAGDIGVRSRPGETVFTVCLPLE